MRKVIVKQEVILVYLELLKGRFGENLGEVIEEVLLDSINMDFEIPKNWGDEHYKRWAKVDLEWNATEEEEELVDVEYAQEIYKSNLSLDSIEDYFI